MYRHRAVLPIFAPLAVLAALAAVVFVHSAPGSVVAGPNCSADGSIDAEEQAMLDLVNDHREDNGLPPLELSDKLNRAASWKSQHMASAGYFAHDDTPINRTWVQRFRDCGYGYNTWIGENIAAGHSDAAATFEQWRNSPGHNANMLHTNYVAVGIGRAYDEDSTYRWYWTTDFGGFADGYTPVQTAAPTPAATPTPSPSAGPAGVRMPGGVPDADGDGCPDAFELGPDPTVGGLRDPENYWDFYDTPTASNAYDGRVDLYGDIFHILERFGSHDSDGQATINRNSDPLAPPASSGYHPAFDRSAPVPGADPWDLGPPDGTIDLFSDVVGAAAQFGHTCG